MLRTRVIPVLLKKGTGLVKTTKFKDPRYLGDPINIIRIFNDKEADEIIVLDIMATAEKRGPDFQFLQRMTGQAFMPLAYGGGVTRTEQVGQLLAAGVEKVVINTAAVEHPELIRDAAAQVGSQSVVVAIDASKGWTGYNSYVRAGSSKTKVSPVELAKRAEELGAGEIFLQSIDRDGLMGGYDIDLIKAVSAAVTVPVIACGGAGTPEHLRQAVTEGGASSAAAGSMFVFHGKHRAVLVSYVPSESLSKDAAHA